MTDQDLINRLAAQVANEKRARERGDARSIGEYKIAIANTLGNPEARGYDKLECLEVCGA